MFSLCFCGMRARRWLLAIGALVGLGWWGSGASLRAAVDGTVVVPRVAGGAVAAYNRLHAAGLRVSVPNGLSFSSSAPPTVARMVPMAGKRVARGSVVTLYLSFGMGRFAVPMGRLPSYVVPKLRGGPVSTAYGWARNKRLVFRAYLGPLKAGNARSLFANYRVVRQRPAAGVRLTLGERGRTAAGKRASFRLTPLTVWGAQQAPVSKPKSAPPQSRAPVPAAPISAPPPAPVTPPPPAPVAPPPPSAETGQVSATGQTTATLTGTVNPQGTATSYSFSYGPTSGYGAQTQPQPAGSGKLDVPATSAVSGLSAATIYHYRLVATSSAGTTDGADKRFATSGYYQNPIYRAAAMPDPFVLDNRGRHSDYWAFGTGNLFPVLHSFDLVHWSPQGTAMTARPAWVTGFPDWHPWAPSVLASDQACPGTTSSGCYVMYYVGLSAQLNVNCIGVATSPTPGGPYSDQGPLALANSTGATSVSSATSVDTPLGCGDDAGAGNIDPSPFIDSSGQAYLYVSTDRSCSGGSCTLKPTISVIPLTPDLLHASGSRVALFSGDVGTWEASGVNAPTVEGPSMELHNGTYYLFYSGGSWQAAYGMGYATATSPTGPFAKSPSNPILAQSSAALSPGGGDALLTGPHGGLWMVYHGRDSTYTEPRTLRLDPFTWRRATSADAADVPVINGPTATPQATQP